MDQGGKHRLAVANPAFDQELYQSINGRRLAEKLHRIYDRNSRVRSLTLEQPQDFGQSLCAPYPPQHQR
jgi:hypothetical protein